jgi:thiol-disulfide isomerase/thioredoxin
MKTSVTFSGRLIVLLLLVLLSSCEPEQTSSVNEIEFKTFLEQRDFEITKEVSLIPDFPYRLLGGQEERLAINQGSIILLNFWATWCFPCKLEMPDLEELKHKMKGEKFRILAVNSGDSAIKVRSFIDQYPYSFDIVLDENRDITKLLKIVGLPTTFILNRDLKIMGKVMGPINWKDDVFIEYLKKFSRT